VKLAGKVLVVTGGGDGMGRAVVLEPLRRQARVTAVDIRQDSLDETARQKRETGWRRLSSTSVTGGPWALCPSA
jgi:NAD(P)-dependent dehydrogenase (short-subunit alcohol dehydrogenase family)